METDKMNVKFIADAMVIRGADEQERLEVIEINDATIITKGESKHVAARTDAHRG